MRIKIINPAIDISSEMNRRWEIYLKKYLRADTELDFENIPWGFPSVETETQGVINGAEVLKIVEKTQGKGYDGIFINCFDDPAVYAAREISDIPVLGPYESSIRFSSMLSERLAIISTDANGVLSEERKGNIHKTGNLIYKIINIDMTVLELSNEKLLSEKLLRCCKQLEEEQVGAVVLGCTGMSRVVDMVSNTLATDGAKIQIVEPLRIGVTSLEYMIINKFKNPIYCTSIGAFPR